MTINFITPDEVKEYTEIPKNVENRQLEESITFAQDEHIRYVLGDDLYEELQDQLANGSLTTENKALLDELRLSLSYYTHYEAMPFITFQTRRSGLISRTGEDSENITAHETIEYYRLQIRKRAIKYQEFLIKFLNKNVDDYPLWESEYKDCSTNSGLYKDKNGIFFY